MKISLVSDTHCESGSLELPGGEVLVLAGDICEYRSFKKRQQNIVDFFDNQCSKYQQVFMVMGNHESYHHRLDKTYNDLKSLLPANITLLENETVDYQGVVFVGATLWTNFHRGNPMTMMTVKEAINDFRVIQNYYPNTGLYHKLTPEFTYRIHQDTLEYFRKTLDQYQNRPVVVITHHAPLYQSIHERFRNDHHMNGAYASDLSEFILDHPQIKIFCHGHTHTAFDYMIGSTRVLCNPRGYYPHGLDTGFDPNLVFEV